MDFADLIMVDIAGGIVCCRCCVLSHSSCAGGGHGALRLTPYALPGPPPAFIPVVGRLPFLHARWQNLPDSRKTQRAESREDGDSESAAPSRGDGGGGGRETA